MEKNKVQNDKIQPEEEMSNEDLDKVAGGRFRQDTMESVSVDKSGDTILVVPENF